MVDRVFASSLQEKEITAHMLYIILVCIEYVLMKVAEKKMITKIEKLTLKSQKRGTEGRGEKTGWRLPLV